LPSTGIECPFGRSNSSAGPPAQHAVAHLGHLQLRIDLGGDALQFADLFELRDKIAQVAVFHGCG
jgi:hypothetical protein